MNNKEYIDRKPLIEKLERTIINPQTSFINNILIGMLKNAPATDVVEVVRCKDCIYYTADSNTQGVCYMHHETIKANEFCSYGEKKGGV